ncbi:MAG: 3-methyl-2-oxobutanoate hydroxymethyltransferase [Pseudomonadota bacterium]
MKPITISNLQAMKSEGKKFACLTAYDASFAKLFDQQGIEVLLIGDSLGMVLKGKNDTLSVTTDEIAYHVASVAAGTENAFIMADMPFMSYATKKDAYANAKKLMAAGANMVKLEGGKWLEKTIKGLVQRGIPVCAHIGLTPQMVHVFGGFKVQGRQPSQAEAIVKSAQALESAGAQMLLMECVPTGLAKQVTEALTIPTIGIGAGKHTDGQILVMHDLMGVSANYMPKFTKNFLAETSSIAEAVQKYKNDVASGDFPDKSHSFD